jgi:molybdate transport system ATP-binding protein
MLSAAVALRIGTLAVDVAVEAHAGETVAVLGPNGAGKTTLLRAIAGLVRADRATITLNGDVLDDTTKRIHVPPERRRFGFVFQDYLLFPHLSAIENVEFGLRAAGASPGEARRRAMHWLDRVGAATHADVRPRELSGGLAQRVALARALALEPRVLLLDEPLAALDATARGTIRRDLKRHLASFGGIRMVVTHDPIEAMALADRMVILEAGHVVQAGTAADVSAHPRSRYVADLVGLNLWRGVAADGEIATEGATLHVADDASGEVFAVVHPRAVTLHRQRPEGSARNVWHGRTLSLDEQGERVRVAIAGALPIVAEITPASARELGLADGVDVWVSVKATEITVYAA